MKFESATPHNSDDHEHSRAGSHEHEADSDIDTHGPEKIGGRFRSFKARREGAERAVQYLDDSGLAEIFSSDEKKAEWIQQLTPESLTRTLDELYSQLSGIRLEDLEKEKDGAGIYGKGGRTVYIPPDRLAREQAVNRIMLPALKLMSPKDAALYMGLCINLMHQYPDGNGRLSRLMHELLIPGNDDMRTSESKERLKSEISSRDGTLNCDTSLIGKETDEILADSVMPIRVTHRDDIHVLWPYKLESGTYVDEEGIDSELDDARLEIAHLLDHDRRDFLIAAMKYAKDFEPEILLDAHPMTRAGRSPGGNADEGRKPTKFMLSIATLLESLKTRDDCRNFYLLCYQFIKALRFKVFADVILNSQKFPVPESEGAVLKNLLEYRMIHGYVDELSREALDLDYDM